VKVVTFNGDLNIDRVNKRILQSLKPYLEERNSLFESLQVAPLLSRDVPRYEKCYLYKESKFGLNSPFDISHPTKSKENVAVYREKLYYFRTPEELEVFQRTPDVFVHMDTVPLDVGFKPICFLLGPPSSGKTETCARLAKSIGVVHL
jgi:YHS domain-containing protein